MHKVKKTNIDVKTSVIEDDDEIISIDNKDKVRISIFNKKINEEKDMINA